MSEVDALFEALEAGDADTVEELLDESGINVNTVLDPTDNSPLHVAVLSGSEPTLCLLLDRYRADPTVRNPLSLETPLHMAAQSGNVRAVAALVAARGADAVLDARDEYGATALHYAARLLDAAMVEALLDAGAAPNITDEDDATPLSLARTAAAGARRKLEADQALALIEEAIALEGGGPRAPPVSGVSSERSRRSGPGGAQAASHTLGAASDDDAAAAAAANAASVGKKHHRSHRRRRRHHRSGERGGDERGGSERGGSVGDKSDEARGSPNEAAAAAAAAAAEALFSFVGAAGGAGPSAADRALMAELEASATSAVDDELTMFAKVLAGVDPEFRSREFSPLPVVIDIIKAQDATKYAQLESWDAMLDTAMSVIVKRYDDALNVSITNFGRVSSSIEHSVQDMRQLKESLGSMKGLLTLRARNIKRLYMATLQYKEEVRILKRVQEMLAVPAALEDLIHAREYLPAVRMLNDAIAALCSEDLQNIGALNDVMKTLFDKRSGYNVLLIDSLADAVYGRGAAVGDDTSGEPRVPTAAISEIVCALGELDSLSPALKWLHSHLHDNLKAILTGVVKRVVGGESRPPDKAGSAGVGVFGTRTRLQWVLHEVTSRFCVVLRAFAFVLDEVEEGLVHGFLRRAAGAGAAMEDAELVAVSRVDVDTEVARVVIDTSTLPGYSALFTLDDVWSAMQLEIELFVCEQLGLPKSAITLGPGVSDVLDDGDGPRRRREPASSAEAMFRFPETLFMDGGGAVDGDGGADLVCEPELTNALAMYVPLSAFVHDVYALGLGLGSSMAAATPSRRRRGPTAYVVNVESLPESAIAADAVDLIGPSEMLAGCIKLNTMWREGGVGMSVSAETVGSSGGGGGGDGSIDMLAGLVAEGTAGSRAHLYLFLTQTVTEDLVPRVGETFVARAEAIMSGADVFTARGRSPRGPHRGNSRCRPLLVGVLEIHQLLLELNQVMMAVPHAMSELVQVMEGIVLKYWELCQIRFSETVAGTTTEGLLSLRELVAHLTIEPGVRADRAGAGADGGAAVLGSWADRLGLLGSAAGSAVGSAAAGLLGPTSSEMALSPEFVGREVALSPEFVGREVALLRWLVEQPPSLDTLLDEADSVALLACICDSTEWLADRVDALGHSGRRLAGAYDPPKSVLLCSEHAAGSGGPTRLAGTTRPLRQWPAQRVGSGLGGRSGAEPLAGEASVVVPRCCERAAVAVVHTAAATLAAHHGVTNNLAALSDKFRALSETVLFALRLELRVHVYYYLRGLRDVGRRTRADGASGSHHQQPDYFVIDLNADLEQLANVALRPFLAAPRVGYVFGGIEYIMADVMIQSMALVDRVSGDGLASLTSDVTALEQHLGAMSVVSPAAAAFARVRAYFELLRLTFKKLLATVSDASLDFTRDEFAVALRLVGGSAELDKAALSILDRLT